MGLTAREKQLLRTRQNKTGYCENQLGSLED
jgi:hypothetical protein